MVDHFSGAINTLFLDLRLNVQALLECQHYPEAVETFESASKFMRIVSQTLSMQQRSPNDAVMVQPDAAFAASTLPSACQRLINIKRDKQVTMESNDSLGLQLKLRVLTYGETPVGSLREYILRDSSRTCHHQMKTTKSFLAIRIEHVLNSVEREDFLSLVEVESCIILYNFAVANSFMASVAHSAPNGQQVLDVAFKLAVLACSLVQSLRLQLEQRLDNTLIGEDLLPLSIIMHTTLQGLASVCVSQTDFLAYEAYVVELTHEFLSKELILIEQIQITSAAAA